MPESEAPLVGTTLTLPGAILAELLAEPFDLVWVDLEHGAFGALDAQEVILGVQAAGTRAMVRLPADAFHMLTPVLDAGADGVVLADVADAAVARAAVARILHPPAGTRGWGPRRSILRGRLSPGDVPQPSVWAQIESAEGVANAAEIAAVDGIDALVVGTADLSIALGVPLELEAPVLVAAIETVRDACRTANVRFGLAGAVDLLPSSLIDEASLLIHSTEAKICVGAVDAEVERIRGLHDAGRRGTEAR